MRLDPEDVTRAGRRASTIALAGIPFMVATAIPWVSRTAVASDPSLVDAISLALFWLTFRGSRWARVSAAAIGALRGVKALYDAMLARMGGAPIPTILVQVAVGLLLLFSASILFGSSALDEPGPKQSLGLRELPWEGSLLSGARSPSNAVAPVPVSPPRRGGWIAPWFCGIVAVASWLVPAALGVGIMDQPRTPDPEAPGEANYYTSVINVMVVAFVVGSYVVSLWFPLGALLLVPTALWWRHPARFLVLRPFDRAQLSRTLVHVLRKEVAPLGHCYTLADAAIRVSRWLRAPLVLGQLTTFVFRQRTIASPEDIERLAQRMRDRLLRNLNWLASRRKIFPVACIHEAWRPCLMRLVSETDVVVVDLSGLGKSIQWELGFLEHTGHAHRAVFLIHEDFQAEFDRVSKQLPAASSASVILYGRNGLRDQGALTKAVLEMLERPRPSVEDERVALAAFLAREDAQPAQPPVAGQSVPSVNRRTIGLAVAAIAVVALIAWAQPGLREPERPVSIAPELSKAAQDLAEQASELLKRPESVREAAALAAESLSRVPTSQADSTLRAALSALNCRDGSPGVVSEWSVASPARARLFAAKSRPWLVAELGGAFFAVDTEKGTVTQLPWSMTPGTALIDLAVSEDGERMATVTLEHGPPARTSSNPVGDTVRLRSRSGDALWSRDAFGVLIGLGFVRGRLWVVTRPENPPTGCSDASPTGERWCGTIIDAESGELVASYRAHAAAWHARFSNDGSVMAVTTNSGLDLWSMAQSTRVTRIPGCYLDVLAISDDNRKVACVAHRRADGAEILFGMVGAPAETMATVTASGRVFSLLLDADASTMLATQGDGTLSVWDTGTRQLTAQRPFADARDLAFGPGQRTAIVASEAGLSATLVRAGDLIAKACKACDVTISECR